jgi:ATP-dependent RNA helicase DeaD
MDKFKELGLSEGLLQAIRHKGFTEPSEIQQKTIPLVLEGKDVIGSSATGSGKTLAFGAGILDRMKRGYGIQALILTPTRELAEQITDTLRSFSQHTGLKIKEIYGGVGMGPQIHDLKIADIVVGTPGRILDHLSQRTLNLQNIRYLVLDEADRMLDMGFIRDVESIINRCPKNRQTLLFSATMSAEISYIAMQYMRDPVKVEVNDRVDPSKLHQRYYDVTQESKFSLLLHLLKQEKNGVVMVFCNTRRNVDRLHRALEEYGVHSRAIHGGLSQNKRSSTLQSFHDRRTLILICTDVAARGLDIKDVSHVYNFDLPTISSDYIHRIGRTARAGKNGIAISFVSSGDHSEFRQICRETSVVMEKAPVPEMRIIPIFFDSNADRREARNRGRGGRGGFRRGSGRRSSFRNDRGRRFSRGNSSRFRNR